jgi:hypothetical protein
MLRPSIRTVADRNAERSFPAYRIAPIDAAAEKAPTATSQGRDSTSPIKLMSVARRVAQEVIESWIDFINEWSELSRLAAQFKDEWIKGVGNY